MLELAVTVWVAIVGGIAAIVLVGIALLWPRMAGGDQQARESRTGDPWLLRAPLLPLVLAVVSGLIAVYALILHFAFGAADFQLPAQANITSPILVAATLIAGTLTAAYAVLKLRAHLLAEARGKLDANGELRAGEKHKNDQEAAYSERFSEAVRLLADTRPISRIAGAHLILAIGDEWKSPGAQQRCFDVLLSHLRGLNIKDSLEDESKSKSSREEVRLITGELLRRLGDGPSAWGISIGDFSGAVLADLHFGGVSGLASLDLRGAHILGDLSIPAKTSATAPQLSGLLCDGDLKIESSPAWQDTKGLALDLSDAEVGGSVALAGAPSSRTLDGDLLASGLAVEGDLSLDFDLFLGDVTLDSASIAGRVMLGSPDRGAFYGTVVEINGKPVKRPTLVSAVGTTFGEFNVRRSDQGPRLDLTEAEGEVDLTGSTFHVEVTANNLDASAGLQIKDATFDSLFVLDGATLPRKVDLHGVTFSKDAKGSFKASNFALREEFLTHDEEVKPDQPFKDNRIFDWRTVIAPFREQYSSELIDDLDLRLSQIETSLPVDWHTRTTFTAKVMSAVSRAVARADAPETVENTLQRALRESLHLASDEVAQS